VISTNRITSGNQLFFIKPNFVDIGSCIRILFKLVKVCRTLTCRRHHDWWSQFCTRDHAIIHLFTSLFAVQIYDLSYVYWQRSICQEQPLHTFLCEIVKFESHIFHEFEKDSYEASNFYHICYDKASSVLLPKVNPFHGRLQHRIPNTRSRRGLN